MNIKNSPSPFKPFTTLSVQMVSTSKVSDVLPIMEHICTEWNLDIKRQRDYDIMKRILINSVKNN